MFVFVLSVTLDGDWSVRPAVLSAIVDRYALGALFTALATYRKKRM